MNTIARWITLNKLTLNAAKTKFMLIKPGHTAAIEKFYLEVDKKALIRVQSFKYLGITIQENLKWNMHTDMICKKIVGIASVLKRLGNRINQATKLSIYHSVVQSHLSYLSPIWSTSICKLDRNRLQIAQNYAIRRVFNYEYFVLGIGTSQIMRNYNILNVNRLTCLNENLLMFKINKGLLKCTYRVEHMHDHQYSLRYQNPRLAAYRTALGKTSIFRSCLEIALKTRSINSTDPLHIYRKNLKKKLLQLTDFELELLYS